jgi:hypothetical protein
LKKALVVTNCATAAYTSGLRALFPDWEVKGANLDVALAWLGPQPNGAFRNFLSETNLVVLGSENESEFADFTHGKDILSIPYFYFRGYHPDSFHLGAGAGPLPSVLGTGNLHSRIAVAAFVLGLGPRQTVTSFNAHTYERIGYFSLFEAEMRSLFERFAAKGIDLAQAFERWRTSGNILYTYNHPKAFVFNDILVEALAGRLFDASKREWARAALAAIPDYLEPSIRWPIYPDIAAKYGIETDFHWRTGVSAGPQLMTLDDFVVRSFETLARYPDLNANCIPGFEACRAALAE